MSPTDGGLLWLYEANDVPQHGGSMQLPATSRNECEPGIVAADTGALRGAAAH